MNYAHTRYQHILLEGSLAFYWGCDEFSDILHDMELLVHVLQLQHHAFSIVA